MKNKEKDIEELVEKYKKLTPQNKLNYLSNLRVMLATQENTRKEIESENRKRSISA